MSFTGFVISTFFTWRKEQLAVIIAGIEPELKPLLIPHQQQQLLHLLRQLRPMQHYQNSSTSNCR
jgi:hypothetical protein